MADDFLAERRQALEESFFANQDRQLLERLRAQLQEEEQLQALSAASGIQDLNLLKELASLGIDAQTVAALSLIPLVEVAWAHGGIAPEEREAVLQAAEENGVKKDTPAHELLERWLDNKPSPKLLNAWKDYVTELRSAVTPATFDKVRTRIMERAEQVARAAGGFLGLATIAPQEQAMLDELEQALRG